MGATVSATFWPVFMAYLAVLQYAGLLCHWQIAQILAWQRAEVNEKGETEGCSVRIVCFIIVKDFTAFYVCDIERKLFKLLTCFKDVVTPKYARNL